MEECKIHEWMKKAFIWINVYFHEMNEWIVIISFEGIIWRMWTCSQIVKSCYKEILHKTKLALVPAQFSLYLEILFPRFGTSTLDIPYHRILALGELSLPVAGFRCSALCWDPKVQTYVQLPMVGSRPQPSTVKCLYIFSQLWNPSH